MRELTDARGQLADLSVSFDKVERNLRRAQELARDCRSAYEVASPDVRRLFNQAFFVKLYVHQDGDVTHEYAEPFKILLDPRLPARLADETARARLKYTDWAGEEDGGTRSGLAESDAAGSNFEVMVEHSGIEPLTS